MKGLFGFFSNEHSLLGFFISHCFRDYTWSLESKCSNLCNSYINQQMKIKERCGKEKKITTHGAVKTLRKKLVGKQEKWKWRGLKESSLKHTKETESSLPARRDSCFTRNYGWLSDYLQHILHCANRFLLHRKLLNYSSCSHWEYPLCFQRLFPWWLKLSACTIALRPEFRKERPSFYT